MVRTKRRFVVSLGGSLIVPDTIDTDFLQRFRQTLFSLTEEGYSFLIIPGGGATARRYQEAARELGVTDSTALDWVGIRASRSNAELLKAVLRDGVYPDIIMDNHNLPPEGSYKVLVAAGGAPGRSSDAGSVELARAARVDTVINLSNIAHVYSDDPRKNIEAEAYREISWDDYRKIIPTGWDPGLSTPFDPVASKMAQESGLTVAILNGNDIGALQRFVSEGVCVGTLIKPE